MLLEKIAPKNFLYCYTLRVGAFSSGILFMIVSVIWTLVALSEALAKDENVSRYAHAHAIVVAVDSVLMVIVDAWFLCGLKSKKTTIILSWLVINTLWVLQVFTMLIILICLHRSDTDVLPWIFAWIFGLILIGTLIYSLLVAYGHWLELNEFGKSSAE